MVMLKWFVIGYLSGMIPYGYYLGKLFKNVDITEHGSGNIGTTNVFRILGYQLGAVVLLLDISKAYFPAQIALTAGEPIALVAGMGAFIGHVFSLPLILIKGRLAGGKGVACALGLGAVLFPVPSLCAFVAWAMIAIITKYVSLASISACGVVCLAQIALVGGGQQTTVLIALCALIVWKHKANIIRLIHGTERKIGDDVKTDQKTVCFLIGPQDTADLSKSPLGIPLRFLIEHNLISRKVAFILARMLGTFFAEDFEVPLKSDPVRVIVLSMAFLPRDFKNPANEQAILNVMRGSIRQAKRLGATVFGIGAYGSTIGGKGKTLQDEFPEIVITNGAELTFYSGRAIVESLKEQNGDKAKVVIIGAGEVGRGLVLLVVRHTKWDVRVIAPQSDDYARTSELFSQVAKGRVRCLSFDRGNRALESDLLRRELQEANYCFCASSAGRQIIVPNTIAKAEGRKIGPPIKIYDASTPGDVNRSVVEISGVTLHRFGAVPVRGDGPRFEIYGKYLGKNTLPACMVQTILLGLFDFVQAKELALINGATSLNQGKILHEKMQEEGLEFCVF